MNDINYKADTIRQSSAGTNSQWEGSESWNATDGFSLGRDHGHKNGSPPSPSDVLWFASMNAHIVNDPPGMAKFIAKATVLVASYAVNYAITIKDFNKVLAKKQAYDADPAQAISDLQHAASEYALGHPNATQNQVHEAAIIELYGDAINFYKADKGKSNYVPVTNDGDLSYDDC